MPNRSTARNPARACRGRKTTNDLSKDHLEAGCFAKMGMTTSNVQWPPSLWAAQTPPGPELPALKGSAQADVVVIGAGFTGLSTALHLREAGIDVAVVEAMEPGWGASGRNNGQVIPTLSRPDPDDIVARHGAAGERFVAMLRDSAATLFDTVRRYDIAAEQEQAGWVQPVHSPGRIKIAERRVKQWSKYGAPVELLSREQVSDMLGSQAWHGGFWNKTGGHINPLALARGLTRTVLGLGGRIFARSPVIDYERRGDRWLVRTAQGEISARALVLASNAYTGEFSKALAPEIAHEVMPVLSWQMATQPLSDNVRKTIIPARQAMSDTHGELYFARYDARNRLVTGGAVIGPGDKAERLKARVTERLQRLWPQIGDVSFDYVWNGYVGMTTDYMPRIHKLGPDAYGWTGCNGRAVALTIPLGAELAKAVRGVPNNEPALPFTAPVTIPAHALLRKVAPLMLLLYRRRDARELS
jgi:glycine/D-amino acid oxidase-like deaminating enzyme